MRLTWLSAARGRSACYRTIALILLALLNGCTPPDLPSAPVSYAGTPVEPRPPARSGLEFQSADTQALQRDAFANPGLLWVDQGAVLFAEPTAGGPACASCHRAEGLRGAASRYPMYDAETDALLDLTGRVNRCRTAHQQVPVFDLESPPLLALTAFVAHQSHGLPMKVRVDGPARPYFEQGRAYFHQRRGQLNLACNHCHEDHVGGMLRGDRLSQGQINGYPLYRLEWQALGSLQRRLRFCNAGVRAQPHPYGAPGVPGVRAVPGLAR